MALKRYFWHSRVKEIKMKIKLASIAVCLGWDSCDHIPSSELPPAEALEEAGSGFLRDGASEKLPSSEKDAGANYKGKKQL